MYSIPPISAIPILAIMNLIIVRDPMYTLPPTVYRPSFFGGVFWGRSPTCSILRKKECPIGTARSGIIVIVIGR